MAREVLRESSSNHLFKVRLEAKASDHTWSLSLVQNYHSEACFSSSLWVPIRSQE